MIILPAFVDYQDFGAKEELLLLPVPVKWRTFGWVPMKTPCLTVKDKLDFHSLAVNYMTTFGIFKLLRIGSKEKSYATRVACYPTRTHANTNMMKPRFFTKLERKRLLERIKRDGFQRSSETTINENLTAAQPWCMVQYDVSLHLQYQIRLLLYPRFQHKWLDVQNSFICPME